LNAAPNTNRYLVFSANKSLLPTPNANQEPVIFLPLMSLVLNVPFQKLENFSLAAPPVLTLSSLPPELVHHPAGQNDAVLQALRVHFFPTVIMLMEPSVSRINQFYRKRVAILQ
jgi:hypothetical protein